MTAIAKKDKKTPVLLPAEMGKTLPGAGAEWLDTLRANAAQAFSTAGLPSVRDEEWRYTDLRVLKKQQYNLADTVPDVSDALAKLPDYGLPRAVLVNGYFAPACSSLGDLPEGVHVDSLAMLLQSDADQLKGLLGSCLPEEQHGFTQLNTAFCLDGVVVRIDKGVKLEQPLEIVHVTTTGEQATVSHARNLIVAEPLAEGSIIERAIADKGENEETVYLNNSVTEIVAHDGAQIQHYKVQADANSAFHIGGVFANQGRDSNVVNHNIALGGRLVRNDIQLNLLGQNGHAGMNGLIVGHGKQHVHNHTEVQHKVPHCSSDEYYKSVLDEQSRAVFRGRIVVAQDAQKTDAEQQNNNLLLSPDAEADSKPQLEIYADDVQCSHGATVGQLEAKSLFYLQSRGIHKDDARRLLTFAFVNELLERVSYAPLQVELTQRFLGELLPDTYQDYYQDSAS